MVESKLELSVKEKLRKPPAGLRIDFSGPQVNDIQALCSLVLTMNVPGGRSVYVDAQFKVCDLVYLKDIEDSLYRKMLSWAKANLASLPLAEVEKKLKFVQEIKGLKYAKKE
jgi:hypothetical protein